MILASTVLYHIVRYSIYEFKAATKDPRLSQTACSRGREGVGGAKGLVLVLKRTRIISTKAQEHQLAAPTCLHRLQTLEWELLGEL
jgi:hypothetical protein